MYIDEDELLPGDKIKISGEFTVSSYDGYSIETEEGPSFDVLDLEYDVVESPRPENWPPQTHDVWRVNHSAYLHALDDDFYDEYGGVVDLAEYMADCGVTLKDFSLAFRPGVVDAAVVKKTRA